MKKHITTCLAIGSLLIYAIGATVNKAKYRETAQQAVALAEEQSKLLKIAAEQTEIWKVRAEIYEKMLEDTHDTNAWRTVK